MYSVYFGGLSKTTDFGALFQNTFGSDIGDVQYYVIFYIL